MKKIFKTAMFAVAVMAAGYGGYKTYSTYTVKDGTLVSENIEALSQSGEDGYMLPEFVVECGRYEGKCWARSTQQNEAGKYPCYFTGSMSDYCTGEVDSI